jgi:hypothetical protein
VVYVWLHVLRHQSTLVQRIPLSPFLFGTSIFMVYVCSTFHNPSYRSTVGHSSVEIIDP